MNNTTTKQPDCNDLSLETIKSLYESQIMRLTKHNL